MATSVLKPGYASIYTHDRADSRVQFCELVCRVLQCW